MRLFSLIFLFLSSICHAESDAISSLSYHLEHREQSDHLEDLWSDAAKEADPNILQLARYYFDEAMEHPQEKAVHLQRSIELLDYLTETRAAYLNFDDNQYIDSSLKKRIRPHLMPLNHPIKPILDIIFATRVTENIATFTAAGFQVLHDQATSFVKVAYHPCTPGYLYKVYLDDEVRQKSHQPGWHWLCNRCEGAARIRRHIKKKKIHNFVVPDKWLYPLNHPNPNSPAPQPVILVVQDMNIYGHEATIDAWKNKITKKHLDELNSILSHKMGSRFLSGNVPYTKDGKFAFIDTEYPKRKISLYKITPYLSPKMQKYWKKIIKDKR